MVRLGMTCFVNISFVILIALLLNSVQLHKIHLFQRKNFAKW